MKTPCFSPETHDDNDRYLYNRLTSSLTAPPETGENACAVLADGEWCTKVNRVGQHYYQPDGTKVKITSIGVDIPAGCIQDDPPSKYHTTHDGTDWILDIDLAKKDVYSAIQTEKKQVRDGGVTIDDVLFDTDVNARISYQEFQSGLSADASYTVNAWRASNGNFVVMESGLFSQVITASETLRTAVFEWQKAKEAEVSAATTLAELELISTEYPS